MSSLRGAVSTTVAAELSAAASHHPDVVALHHPGGQLTYGGLDNLVRQAARGLIGVGMHPRARVGIWAPNTLEAAVALLATIVAGGVVVPLNTRYRPTELGEILRRAECDLVIAPSSFLGRDLADEVRQVAPAVTRISFGDGSSDGSMPWSTVLEAGGDGHPGRTESGRLLDAAIAAQSGEDVIVVQYTSGTTGTPRGALLRQGPMLATTATWCDVVGMARGDVYPVAYPLSHVGGFKTGLLTTLVAGATAVLIPVVTPESVVSAIDDHGATILSCPPPILRDVLSAFRQGRLEHHRLRQVVTGSAIVPPQLVRELVGDLGVVDVIIGYGLTEASGVCTMTRRGDPIDLVCHTLGTPIPEVEVRIAGDPGPGSSGQPEPVIGEIEVSGPSVMTGYLDDPDATAAVIDDGWLRTGDLGWIGEDGYVRIAGRSKDMVVVGGFNVYPAEIENVLNEHPGVDEAAVVGVPHERLGEVTAAFVVLAPSADPDPAELVSWCRERLANFKVPRWLWIVESLPRASLGKVAKTDLRARAITASSASS